MRITRRVEFSASHVCANPLLTPEENRAIYGEGANPRGHGHNFVVEVTLEGSPDPVTGMVFDLKALKDILKGEVVEPMDHRFLNHEVAPFDRVIPTPENIAIEIWKRIEGPIRSQGGCLHGVRVYEHEDLFVDYFGEAA